MPTAPGSMRSARGSPSSSRSTTSTGPTRRRASSPKRSLEVTDRAPLLIAVAFRVDLAVRRSRFRLHALEHYPHRVVEQSRRAALRAAAAEELLGMLIARRYRARRGVRSVVGSGGGQPAVPRGVAARADRGGWRRAAAAHVGADAGSGPEPPARARRAADGADRPLARAGRAVSRRSRRSSDGRFPAQVLERVAASDAVRGRRLDATAGAGDQGASPLPGARVLLQARPTAGMLRSRR